MLGVHALPLTEDVAGPVGGPDPAYEARAALLEDLVERAVDPASPPAPGSS